jgi:hypothetical protein
VRLANADTDDMVELAKLAGLKHKTLRSKNDD